MKTSKVTYLGNLRTEAEHLASGTKIITDAPVDNHGKGEFFSPTDLAATSLASCMFTIMGLSAQTHHIKMEGAVAEVTKVMGTNPRRIVEVIIDFTFPGNYTEKEKKILHLAVDNCPVGKSVHLDLKQTIHLHFNGNES